MNETKCFWVNFMIRYYLYSNIGGILTEIGLFYNYFERYYSNGLLLFICNHLISIFFKIWNLNKILYMF